MHLLLVLIHRVEIQATRRERQLHRSDLPADLGFVQRSVHLALDLLNFLFADPTDKAFKIEVQSTFEVFEARLQDLEVDLLVPQALDELLLDAL